MTPTDKAAIEGLIQPNNLWTAPPRPAVDSVEAERMRAERANDPALIEAARNYKPDAATFREMAKYESRPSAELMFVVLP